MDSDTRNKELMEWLDAGVRAGYVTTMVCCVHDGLPTTADEDNLLINGDDPCVWVLRVCLDGELEAVKANHPASNWRQTSG